jgi:septal ring factor EnvC (AmiA/AmiB activator)
MTTRTTPVEPRPGTTRAIASARLMLAQLDETLHAELQAMAGEIDHLRDAINEERNKVDSLRDALNAEETRNKLLEAEIEGRAEETTAQITQLQREVYRLTVEPSDAKGSLSLLMGVQP